MPKNTAMSHHGADRLSAAPKSWFSELWRGRSAPSSGKSRAGSSRGRFRRDSERAGKVLAQKKYATLCAPLTSNESAFWCFPESSSALFLSIGPHFCASPKRCRRFVPSLTLNKS